MKCEDIVLQEGEMICDKCEGTGEGDSNWVKCKKCLGEGKVDWIENAMGGKPNKQPGFIFIDSSSMMSSTLTVASAKDMKIGDLALDDYIKNVVAKKMAEEMDKILLEQLVNPNSKFEHIFKMMKENK
jgi:hypothetical protein